MLKLRPTLKPVLAFVLSLPVLFFLFYSRPDPAPIYTIVYTDPSSSFRGGGSGGSDSSNAAGEFLSTSSPAVAGDAAGSLLSSGGGNSETNNNNNNSRPPSGLVAANCNCDNSPSSSSSSSSSPDDHLSLGRRTAANFVPNQPVFDSTRTFIFVITPTYTRPAQMADMTRLANTLRLVPDVFWIVAEDAQTESKSVRDLLLRSRIPFVHLLGPRPPTHLDKRSGRGVSNRLKAFEWLRANYAGTSQPGVIYFADDDNAYDVQVFEEMRDTQIVSMFPVGLITQLGMSTPIVSSRTGKIIGFHDPFIGRRKFAVDMAGFAVNLQYFLHRPKATMPYKVGYEEDYFLKSLDVAIWQLEPKADNCTRMLVWHTKTKPADGPKLNLMQKVTKYNETNLPQLYGHLLNDT